MKIGVLVDMDLGQLLADWLDPTILALEDAMNEGVYDRPVQLVVADARGLPRENYLKCRKGYEWLVDQGCVVVLGPMISDNCLQLQELINQRRCSSIGWTGAWRFASDYCFTVANGDIPTEGVMCAQWLHGQGHRKVGMFWEQGSSGRDYADFFREEAQRLGITITREVRLGPNPRGFVDHLAAMRDAGTEAIYYGGYGYATFHFAQAFAELGWDPPRVMGTAFMFYSNTNEWAEGLEGWHGVDQLGEDGANPNYNAMIERFEARSAASPATSWWRSPTTRPGPPSTASPTPPWPRPRKSATGSSASAGCRPPTADPAATSSSGRATTRATRATSSPSASCAAASCASTATTGRSGRRTPAALRRRTARTSGGTR